MRRDARAYLWDVKTAAGAILEFTAGLDSESDAETALVQSAVERKFEIIGEALAQLSRLDPALAHRIPNIREIVAFRSLLIHGYTAVMSDRVWRTVQQSLPHLRSVVTALLDELGSA